MNFISKFSILLFSVAVLFSACNKDNSDIIIPENPNYSPDTTVVNPIFSALVANSSNGLSLGCITIDYPFEMALETSGTVSITTEAEFITALEMVEPNRVVDFVYPLNVTDEDGITTQVADITALGEAFASCIPTGGWVSTIDNLVPAFLFEDLCFELVFPVNLQDETGASLTANNQGEFVSLLASTPELYLTFPLTVLEENGEQTIIADVEAFFNMTYECEGIAPPHCGNGVLLNGFGCNQLVYPFNVEYSNGNVVTVVDQDQYAALIFNGDDFEIQFPFSLLNENGETLEINDFDDLFAALEACNTTIVIIPGDEACGFIPTHLLLFLNQDLSPCGFSVNYPAQVTAQGSSVSVNSLDEYIGLLGAIGPDELSAEYPISVTLLNGTVITFAEENAVCAFLEDCQ